MLCIFCKNNPITFRMTHVYLFTVYRAGQPIQGLNYSINTWHKAVQIGVARFQIKRFKHEDYVRMYNGGALMNMVNRRICYKHHQMRLTICLIMHNRTPH